MSETASFELALSHLKYFCAARNLVVMCYSVQNAETNKRNFNTELTHSQKPQCLCVLDSRVGLEASISAKLNYTE